MCAMKLSFSRLSALARCPRKFDLQYNQKITPLVTPSYFLRGRLMARLLELHHGNRNHEMEPAELEAIAANRDDLYVLWVFAAYQKYYKAVDTDVVFGLTEHRFDLEIAENLIYTGIIDWVTMDGAGEFCVWDHKYTIRWFTRDFGPPELSPQLLSYAYYLRNLGMWPIKAGWNLLIKDAEKDIRTDKLEKAFKRKVSCLTHEMLDRWLEDLLGWAGRIRSNTSWPRNLATCRSYPGQGRCMYLALCENELNDVTMLDFQREETS